MEGNNMCDMEVVQKSEFVKRIVDFTRYMKKEYMDDDGERSLLVAALDNTVQGVPPIGTFIALGKKRLVVANLACAFQQEEAAEILRLASQAAGETDTGHLDAGVLRRHLLYGYVIASVVVLWMLFIVGMQVAGISNWITTVTNLFLMSYVLYVVVRSVLVQRRTLRCLEEERRRETDRNLRNISEGLQGLIQFLSRRDE